MSIWDNTILYYSLWIEKGGHIKTIIDKEKRFCDMCTTEIEDEKHFFPLYIPKRINLENICRHNCVRYDSLDNEQKYIFIMPNQNEDVLKTLSKFVFHSTSWESGFFLQINISKNLSKNLSDIFWNGGGRICNGVDWMWGEVGEGY